MILKESVVFIVKKNKYGNCQYNKFRIHFKCFTGVCREYNFKLTYFYSLLLLLLIFNLAALQSFANLPDRNQVVNNEKKAVVLNNEWQYESAQKAVNLLRKSAEDWEELHEPQKAVFCLVEAAKISQTLADTQTIFQFLSQAIKIAEKNQLSEAEAVASSLFAFFSIENSNEKLGYKYSQKAFSSSEKANTSKAKAYSFFSRAIYEYYYGKMPAAINLFDKSAEFAQETDDIFIINQTLFYVGFAYIRDGNPYKAIAKMNLALQLSQQYNFKRGQALSYFAIATAYYYIEKQKALDFLSKAELMMPADFEWKEKARISGTIGNLYLDLGYLNLAETNFHKAISSHEKSGYLIGKITILTLLADTYLQQSELEKAKQTYESALVLSKSVKDKFRIGVIEEGLGNIEYKKNNYDEAIKHYFQALEIYNEIGVKLPIIENLIGNAYARKGFYQKASGYYNSALSESRKNKDSLQISESLFNHAKVNLKENNLQQAFVKIDESISITDDLYSEVDNTNLKRSFLSSVYDRYELYINILMKLQREDPNKNFAVRALQAAENSRARNLLENLYFSHANFIFDAEGETVKREKEIRILLNGKADKLTDLLNQAAVNEETEKISNEISELEHELEELKGKLKKNSPLYYATKNPAPFDVGEFQKNILDEESLLLEFSLGKEESYLWLIEKTEIGYYILPSREQIETKIQTLRELLAGREMLKDESIEAYQSRIAKAEEDYSKLAGELSRELFGQVFEKFGNKRLIIVPDGKLGYFPVSALPLPNSETGEPILLTNEVVYEPSASTLAILSANKKEKNSATKSLLIFSDPVFTAEDSRVSAANQNGFSAQTDGLEKFRFVESLNSLARLDASKTEADSIVDILSNTNADNFSGFAANRERLLNTSAADYKILHFATHGLIDENRPELSGIVLSRFDENGGKQDEFFRLHDIYGMKLNADLVVLSACNTGIGKEVRGEGLMSLNNAFLAIGGKSVLSTLWKVEDGATLELMKNFYGEIANKKVTPSKALQQAQIKMWRSSRYKSPFYWAAFTIQGDYRNVPDISGNFASRIYLLSAAVLLLLAALFGYRFIRRRNCM